MKMDHMSILVRKGTVFNYQTIMKGRFNHDQDAKT